MAIFLSTVALCVAVVALVSRHPRTLRLDRLELVNGGDCTRIEPGRIEIEREGFSSIGLSVLNAAPYIIGNVQGNNFRLTAGVTSSLLLQDGAELASILPNGIAIEDATTKTAILANGIMPGMPASACKPAAIESKSAKQVEPMEILTKLRRDNPHGLRIHQPETEESNGT
ncbi:MAG TPA: hypothetical protein VHX65_01515 [Pirellulales bacterium]|jgi:hypothetical protein|nr:hypothetical protein [Pirellulales bacterium]